MNVMSQKVQTETISEQLRSVLELAASLSTEVEHAVEKLLGNGNSVAGEVSDSQSVSRGRLNDLTDYAEEVKLRIINAREEIKRLERI